MEDKTENGDQCGRNGRRRGSAQNNAEEKDRGKDTERNKSKGAQRDREREERLLTSTEGHREEEITMSFFRIQESCFIWASFIKMNTLTCQ